MQLWKNPVKKALSFFVAVAMACTTLSGIVSAVQDDPDLSPSLYTDSGMDTEFSYDPITKTLTCNNDAGTKSWQAADDPIEFSDIEKVILKSDVKKIEPWAFMECSNLTSVEMSENLIEIGANAFSGCEKLASLEIPSSVKTMGSFIFDECKSLTSISIPNGVKVIEPSMFRKCSSLSSVTIPDSVTEIKNNVFFGCTALTTLTIPSSVSVLGECLVDGCANLLEIHLGSIVPPALITPQFDGIPEDYKIYVPKDSLNDYHTKVIWNTFKDHIFPEEGTSSGGGSSSGGGGGGGSSTVTSDLVTGSGSALKTPSGTSKKVIDNPVGSKGSTAPITDAVKNAVAFGMKNTSASVSFANYAAVTANGIQAINDAVTKAVAGKDVSLELKVNFDQKVGNAVISRVSVDPAELGKAISGTVKLGVSFDQKNANVVQVNNHFAKYFTNKIVSVAYNEKNALDVNAEFAGKLDLEKTFGSTSPLYFYSYDSVDNAYTRITSPNYFVDTNGYAHITALFGGSIIITDTPLTSK